jgi:predicted nucleic acid-binding protein
MKDGNEMNFVLDASIALAWCFSDENTAFTRKLLIQLENDIALVPTIWSLEVGNILIMAERRKRISYAEMVQFLELLSALRIEVDADTPAKAFHEVLALAYSEKLTTYDAAYIELAMRHGLPLASKDLELCKAAKRLGVHVICE